MPDDDDWEMHNVEDWGDILADVERKSSEEVPFLRRMNQWVAMCCSSAVGAAMPRRMERMGFHTGLGNETGNFGRKIRESRQIQVVHEETRAVDILSPFHRNLARHPDAVTTFLDGSTSLVSSSLSNEANRAKSIRDSMPENRVPIDAGA